MINTKALFKVLLVILAIPAAGLAVSFIIVHNLNSNFLAEGLPELTVICNEIKSGQASFEVSSDLASACREVSHIQLLGRVSILAALVGIFIPTMFWLASQFAGESRRRIAAVFPSVLRLSVLMLAATVLVQGAILTYAAYVAQAYAMGRVYLFAVAAIGLGALIGSFKLIGSSMTFGRKLKMHALGKVLSRSDAPKLFEYVKSLADKLGANAPGSIIVGLEPNFYVTSGDIQVFGDEETVSGETLYISAPLARLMSQQEFTSVIGHELGHFRGDDTVYSMKFAPVYAGLGNSLYAMQVSDDEGISALAKLPAIYVLSYMYELFAANVAKIGRDREHEADKVGAQAGSAEALATALIKLSLYSELWNRARNQNIERLNEGKVADNLSIIFQDAAKFDVEHEKIEDIMQATLEHVITHPTDTHPPVSVRLDALNVQSGQITKDELLVPDDSAIELLDNFLEVEKEITLLEHQLMVALRHAQPPETDNQQNQLLHATYTLASAMVRADGQIDTDEIAVAEEIGHRLFSDFDSVEFRAYCNDEEHAPELGQLAVAMGEALEKEGKDLIIQYLRAISEADGKVSAEEESLLNEISQGLLKRAEASEEQ